jgi:hypothetical protein
MTCSTQAHHQRPWKITERQFANNVHKVFKPAVPFVAACLLVSPVLPPWISVWLSTATFFTVMSQQFHAWSHMKASQLPSAVIALQVLFSLTYALTHYRIDVAAQTLSHCEVHKSTQAM